MFPYIGGKAHHVHWLDQYFPEDAQRFVDVFGGAGWVTVKSQRIANSEEIIYNDLNWMLANVYEVFRLYPQTLAEIMSEMPSSDLAQYREYQREIFQDPDWSSQTLGDPVRAARYLYLQTQIFAGTPVSLNNVPYFVDQKTQGRYPSKWLTLQRKLQKPSILRRLQRINKVLNQDCLAVIVSQDAPGTFFYVDPPYYNREYYYTQEFTREQHLSLAETLKQISGRFALSYYEFPDLKVWFPEDQYQWHRRDVYRSAATRSSEKTDYATRSRAREILITNYDTKNINN